MTIQDLVGKYQKEAQQLDSQIRQLTMQIDQMIEQKDAAQRQYTLTVGKIQGLSEALQEAEKAPAGDAA